MLLSRMKCVSFLSPFFLSSGLVVYYHKVVVAPVELHSKKGSKFARFLRRSLDILNEDYRPTLWCFESRFQTVFASIVRHFISDIAYKREILKFSDGGEAGLDWLEAKERESQVKDEDYDGPIILFLPGLTGHSQSEYIKSFINVAHSVRSLIFPLLSTAR